MIWNTSHIAAPCLPCPSQCGWLLKNDQFDPEMSELPCAPPDIISSIRCSCKQSRCKAPCKCLKSKLRCTEMCSCSGNEENCDNAPIDDCEDPDPNERLIEDSD